VIRLARLARGAVERAVAAAVRSGVAAGLGERVAGRRVISGGHIAGPEQPHAFFTQIGPGVQELTQSAHAPPPLPHASLAVPSAHLSVAVQQPPLQ
jgi:hypothetical protein